MKAAERTLAHLLRFPEGSWNSARDLESELKLDFRQMSRILDYWQEVGAIHTENERGGQTQVQLTRTGWDIAKNLQKRQRIQRGVAIGVIIVALATILIFR